MYRLYNSTGKCHIDMKFGPGNKLNKKGMILLEKAKIVSYWQICCFSFLRFLSDLELSGSLTLVAQPLIIHISYIKTLYHTETQNKTHEDNYFLGKIIFLTGKFMPSAEMLMHD